jgi:hypothetical protein
MPATLEAPSVVVGPAAFQEEEEPEQEEEDVLLGTGEVQIVGIRYYRGVAHPGEFIYLVREPHNPYDSNAIRVDNLHHEKIGHIKRETAAMLVPLIDRYGDDIHLEGIIPRQGNGFNLPLSLEFYATSEAPAPELAQVVKNCMRYAVRMAPSFSSTVSPTSTHPAARPVTIQKIKMDWTKQQQHLVSYLCVASITLSCC